VGRQRAEDQLVARSEAIIDLRSLMLPAKPQARFPGATISDASLENWGTISLFFGYVRLSLRYKKVREVVIKKAKHLPSGFSCLPTRSVVKLFMKVLQ
jgi:hypothetical protein